MNLKKLFALIILCIFFLVGCGKNNKETIIKKITKKVEESNSYNLKGVLEIVNNENSYKYDVNVIYQKENNFKVSLKNQTNNHEQIILRNKDGIYVLTPSLNKSFKFQSDWPHNNSQSYLLQNLIKDIKSDPESTFEEIKEGYIITTKANYSNNKELQKQKIYINKENDIYKVEVMDNDEIIKLKMDINKIEYNIDVNEETFNIEKNMNVSKEIEEEPASKIEDIIYPMYIPKNTYLEAQNKVLIEGGERVILTFSGEHPFMLIQETTNKDNIIAVNGEPTHLIEGIGALDETSLTWINNGIEYYLVSNTLEKQELIEVANSLTTIALSK